MNLTQVKSLKISLPIILFFVLTVLLIGPFELFFANSEEFWFTELDVVKAVLPTAGIALILLCIIFAVLPKKPRRFCQKLLFGIALGFFVQARINISYGSGLLDGSEIQWSDYATYGLLNTAIWILCLALPFILSHIIKKQQTFRKILALAALFLTVIQIPGFAVKIINYEPSKNQNILITKKGMFDIAEKDNIIIFILDGMDETYYQTFLAEKPDYTENLTGFVHYDNTLASGATTNIGITSMFTGIPYIMSESFSEYKSKVWGGENSLRTLHDAGYDVGVYSEIQLYAEENIPYFSNFSDGGMQVGSRLTFLKKLYKLDMVKFFPHFLKRFVWMDTAEFDEAIEVQNTQAYSLNDPKFFSDFNEQGYTYGQYQKAVRVYHLHGGHDNPYMTRDGEFDRNASREDHVYGCFTQLLYLLNNLREHGAFDPALIIITADHGNEHRDEQPIFFLKMPYSTEPYQTNHAPVSLFDLPILLAGFVGKELPEQPYGLDLFTLQDDTVRERHFFKKQSKNVMPVVIEYVTTSSAGDYDNLKKVREYEDISGKEKPYQLGTSLAFGVDPAGNRYITEGFLGLGAFRTFVKAKYNRMEIPITDLPKEGMLHVTIDINGVVSDVAYQVKANDLIVLNGVTDDLITAGSKIDFDVPLESFGKSNVLTLEFEFPELPDDFKFEKTGLMAFVTMKIESKK